MTDFATWRYENLVAFAKESTERINLLNVEIEALNADLKTAIGAYRDAPAPRSRTQNTKDNSGRRPRRWGTA